jgi:Asp-tRNA(Asn)/Glu-tRNA(Gln) amidotransferase C subunit
MSENIIDSKFPVKYMKKIADIPGFVEGIDSMDTDEIKRKILETEGHIYDVDRSKEADEELSKLKEKVSEILKPYRETKAIETAKLKYCIYVLESRGIALNL